MIVYSFITLLMIVFSSTWYLTTARIDKVLIKIPAIREAWSSWDPFVVEHPQMWEYSSAMQYAKTATDRH